MARARRPPQRHTRATRNRSRKTRSLSRRTCCTSCAVCLLSRPTRGQHCRRRGARTGAPWRSRERALPGLGDAYGQRTGSSCLRHSNLPFVVLIRNASTGLHATCRTSLIRSSRARRKARVLPMDPPACALVDRPVLPQATGLLCHTLRPTLSSILFLVH